MPNETSINSKVSLFIMDLVCFIFVYINVSAILLLYL